MLQHLLSAFALSFSLWLAGACSEPASRAEAPPEVRPAPGATGATGARPAAPQAQTPSQAQSQPEACPVIAQRQTRLYFMEGDAAYAELLAQQRAVPVSGLLCFPNETMARESGYRSAEAAGGGKTGRSPVEAVPAPAAAPAPLERAFALRCTGGRQVRGEIDRWSPLSKCPEGYLVTGIQRLDLVGDHNVAITHVNDLSCGDEGCKAWCIGAPCTVEARCCRVEPLMSEKSKS